MRVREMLIALAVVTASPALAVTYDAAATFNGVQGSGGFFHGAFAAGAFTQLPLNTGCPANTTCLRTADSAGPYVAKSTIGSFTAGTITYPGNALVARPARGISYEIAWVPPEAGFWQIDALFWRTDSALDFAAVLPFAVPVRGQPSVLEPFAVLAPSTPSFRFSKRVFLTPGGAFGFDLNAAGANFAADSTAFTFTATRAVPEPASWAMLVVGFVIGGAMLRRRSSVAQRSNRTGFMG